jgi:hypothetical protein
MGPLNDLGLTVVKTAGQTLDQALNQTHYEITGLTGPKAVELARLMRGAVDSISEADIIKYICLGLRRG